MTRQIRSAMGEFGSTSIPASRDKEIVMNINALSLFLGHAGFPRLQGFQWHLHHRAGDGGCGVRRISGRHRGRDGSFTTLGSKVTWINQQILIDMRRADLAVPLTLPVDSAAFTRWHDAPGFHIGAWAFYDQ